MGTRYDEKRYNVLKVATFTLPNDKELRKNLVDTNKALLYSTVWTRLKEDGYVELKDPHPDDRYEWFLEMEKTSLVQQNGLNSESTGAITRGSLVVRELPKYVHFNQQEVDPTTEPELTDEALTAESEPFNLRLKLTTDLLSRIDRMVGIVLGGQAHGVNYTPQFSRLYIPHKEKWRRHSISLEKTRGV